MLENGEKKATPISLTEHINQIAKEKAQGDIVRVGDKILDSEADPYSCRCYPKDDRDHSTEKLMFKGFHYNGSNEGSFYTQTPRFACYDCLFADSDVQTKSDQPEILNLSEVNKALDDQQNNNYCRWRNPKKGSMVYPTVDNWNNDSTHTPNSAKTGFYQSEIPKPSEMDKDLEVQKDSRKIQQHEHSQIAQLLLWRDRPDSPEKYVHYRVALNGASGPATMALTSLFVDETQKKEILGKMNENESTALDNLLYEMQAELRRQTIAFFRGQIYLKKRKEGEKVSKDLNNKDIINAASKFKMKHAAELYLKSVLYRFFLPFLSLEDEYRIANGMKFFLSSWWRDEWGNKKVEINTISNSSVMISSSDMINIIVEILKDTLQRLRGVEALFQVKVRIERSKGDDADAAKADERYIYSIEPLKSPDKNELQIKCLFL